MLNGMVPSEVPLGVVPLGTANVLASELGLDRNPARAAESIPDLNAERVSVGLLTSQSRQPRYFLLMAGVGLDARVVVNVDPELKKRLGQLAFWIGGLEQLKSKFKEFNILADGESLRSGYALASRVRNYGGELKIARTACLFDDYFEMVAFQGDEPFRYLKYFTGVLAHSLHKMEGVTIRKVRHIEFTTLPDAEVAEVYVHVDGEIAGELPATVEIVPDALTLLMPASVREMYTKDQEPAEAKD